MDHPTGIHHGCTSVPEVVQSRLAMGLNELVDLWARRTQPRLRRLRNVVRGGVVECAHAFNRTINS